MNDRVLCSTWLLWCVPWYPLFRQKSTDRTSKLGKAESRGWAVLVSRDMYVISRHHALGASSLSDAGMSGYAIWVSATGSDVADSGKRTRLGAVGHGWCNALPGLNARSSD